MSETKPGMSSLSEDDMMRVLCVCMDRLGKRLQDRIYDIGDMATPTEIIDMIAEELYRLPITIAFMQQDANEDQAECNDTQEVSVKDSVTAD